MPLPEFGCGIDSFERGDALLMPLGCEGRFWDKAFLHVARGGTNGRSLIYLVVTSVLCTVSQPESWYIADTLPLPPDCLQTDRHIRTRASPSSILPAHSPPPPEIHVMV
jgi:hypothetical protein